MRQRAAVLARRLIGPENVSQTVAQLRAARTVGERRLLQLGGSAQRDAAVALRLAAVVSALDSEPGPPKRITADPSGLVTHPASAMGKTPGPDVSGLITAVAERLATFDRGRIWLALAAIRGELPNLDEVAVHVREGRTLGAQALVESIVASARPRFVGLHREWPPVQILVDHVIVDVHHTAQTELATGIQRVARQTARRWQRRSDIALAGWTAAEDNLVLLSDAATRTALHGTPPPSSSAHEQIIVPWRGAYVMPELMVERKRAFRVQSLVHHFGGRSGVIGFDCVPITTAETVADGMGGGFAINLAAVSRMHRVATISQAAADEYLGWQRMLSGAGIAGPEIQNISLAVEAAEPSTGALREMTDRLRIGDMPTVLVVGSHEPRKNHLAVLQAAEQLWGEGLRFSLTFIGGNSWGSHRFTSRLLELQADGRPVQAFSAITDDLLWAGYRVADFTIFPSLNEGFGLPVAESLASGTPVITSAFGSMKELAQAGGTILCDPRDDASVADAMRSLLSDKNLLSRLAAECCTIKGKSWDQYADEVWRYLVLGEVVLKTPSVTTVSV